MTYVSIYRYFASHVTSMSWCLCKFTCVSMYVIQCYITLSQDNYYFFNSLFGPTAMKQNPCPALLNFVGWIQRSTVDSLHKRTVKKVFPSHGVLMWRGPMNVSHPKWNRYWLFMCGIGVKFLHERMPVISRGASTSYLSTCHDYQYGDIRLPSLVDMITYQREQPTHCTVPNKNQMPMSSSFKYDNINTCIPLNLSLKWRFSITRRELSLIIES